MIHDAPAPKPKAKAKAKPADDSDDDSDDEPKAKAKPAAKAKAAPDSDDDDSDDEPAPKPKAKAKAKPAADDSDDDSDDEPAPPPAKKAKVAAKEDSDSDDDEEPAAAPKKKIEVDDKKEGGGGEELTVFIGGLSFSLDEAQLRKDFTECGEIEKLNMPMNEEGKPKGFAFITYKDKAGVEAALKFDGEEYSGRNLKVNRAGDKSAKGKGKDKGKDGKGGKGKGNNDLTAFVRGLPFSVEEAQMRKDFEECGEIVSLRLPMNEEGKPKGIAFVEFKEKEGFEAALKFNETDYGGRTIYVSKAGEGGGKGKDGDKGKGKGKDKGKKGKKGKKDGPSAAARGAMVESTGTKQTFDDSDDE